jgi:hypothetical protein
MMIAVREWSDSDNMRLKALWLGGTSLAQIAEMLLCSRPAIQRQVRVLGLPLRPSPMRPPRTEPKRAKPLARGATTLPPLPSSTEGDK